MSGRRAAKDREMKSKEYTGESSCRIIKWRQSITHKAMTTEERMKEILKDLFEKHGIIDEGARDEFVNKLFESRVIWDILPKIRLDMQKLEVVTRGVRGCLIFDGRYYYILPYNGKAFDCTPDKKNAEEDFKKFENNEDIL